MSDDIEIIRAYQDAWGHHRDVPESTIRHLEDALQRSALEAAPAAHIEPSRCFEPDWMARQSRIWGVAVQLYGIRSPRNWGIGDFSDLKQLVQLAALQGADFVGVNPLHALFAAEPRRYSPYSPSSREFLNVLYIDPETTQTFAISPKARAHIAEAAFQQRLQALRDAALVDYEAVALIKREVFRLIFTDFAALCAREPDHPVVRAFARFAKERGETLRRFAIYQALSCQPGFGDNWMSWPQEFRDSSGTAAHEFAKSDPLAVAYHEFLQWEADAQLNACAAAARDAGMAIGLYLDIAVGAGPESTEGWSEQANIVPGFHIGAPPDAWNEAGQDWGLAVFDPYALRHVSYRVLRRILRSLMRHSSALRIDHVLGFYRLFLVPSGGKPIDGVYLRQPAESLCNMLAEESRANNCLIIGEDLGTVPADFPGLLASHNILSCRLLIFARDGDRFLAPEEYPRNALVSVATHDLPPLLGFIEGVDIEIRKRLGIYQDDARYHQALQERQHERQRLRQAIEAAGFPTGEDNVGVVAAAYGFLARTPCALMIVQMEDLALEREQPNVPGTDERLPNWRHKLSRNLDEIFAATSTEVILGAVRKERPRGQT
ncbi:MAG TPA: 4-alpha-glucanotransferase [Stellaceae bacterium]|jgi:(1->4)-alpha-D-glucan 1-alpha-D-glucosylmutase